MEKNHDDIIRRLESLYQQIHDLELKTEMHAVVAKQNLTYLEDQFRIKLNNCQNEIIREVKKRR